MFAASIRPGDRGPGAFEQAVIPSATKATLLQHPRKAFLFIAFVCDSEVTHAACDPSQKGLLADRPHRHRVIRFRTSWASPSTETTGIPPRTQIGPLTFLSVSWIKRHLAGQHPSSLPPTST